MQLQSLRQNVRAAAADFDALGDDARELSTMRWALKLNNLKIAASEAAPQIVHKALQVIGIMGTRTTRRSASAATTATPFPARS